MPEALRLLLHYHLGPAIRPVKSGQMTKRDAAADSPLTRLVADCSPDCTTNGTADVAAGGQS